ncbi:MAG: SMP-30/gluconolactonase/LRE family protein, partial [SAR86 cluster bacterium]
MSELTEITTGLEFPEGPIAMADGSIILVEIKRGTLSRVQLDGSVEVIAQLDGGPNGAAIGPDGHCYICNNGGFVWHDRNGLTFPGDQPENYSGGRIERVNLATGEVETLYTHCAGNPLRGPNDIVFDQQGGFWFTDHGKNRPRDQDRTGVYYASIDGQQIKVVIFPLEAPNGIGLSPDEATLYVAETPT